MNTAVLTGPRLTLRPLRHTDAAHLHRVWGDPRVTATLNMPRQETLAATMGRLDLMLNQWPDAWAVTVRPDDAAVGSFVLRAWADDRPVASFGYALRYDCWNRGYMTEALSLVLEYAFTVKGYLRVGADHFSVNPASGRVMQKCGMVYEGCLRECAYKDGQPYDLLQYGILKRDWERLYRPAGRGAGA